MDASSAGRDFRGIAACASGRITGRGMKHGCLSLCAMACLSATATAQVTFPAPGVRLPGPQLKWDGAFDVMDWDGNGTLDLIMPSGSMSSYWVHRNEGTPEAPRFGFAHLAPVNFTEVRPFGTKGYNDSIEHSQAIAFGDLSGDGLFDVLVYDGRLTMVLNQGRPHTPEHWEFADFKQRFPGSEDMLKANSRYATGPESMFWNTGIFPRQVLTMTLADWNGDGLVDLIVCRFTGEAPGVVGLGLNEHWTPFGRGTTQFGPPKVPQPAGPTFHDPLNFTPERETWLYLNEGTATAPWFDKSVRMHAGDAPVVAPNPVAFDVDGDGVPDLLSSEAPYRSNAFRVDWPTVPHVVWYRRPDAAATERLEPAQPLRDAKGAPIPAGTQVRVADMRGVGVKDLLVLDAGGSMRWYRNTARPGQPAAFAPPIVLRGTDFARFVFSYQPLVVDWFGPGSRDLILHGITDAHCKWGLRRTALYRNVAKEPGEILYDFAGWLTLNGDPAMVPQRMPYDSGAPDAFGSVVAMMPNDSRGGRRLAMSVSGQIYVFSGLAKDGLTFSTRAPLEIPAVQNRRRGWQEFDLGGKRVRHIRIMPHNSSHGLLRSAATSIVRFEALEGPKNWATPEEGVTASDVGHHPTAPWYRLQNPQAMFLPGDDPGDAPPAKMTSFGPEHFIGPAIISLKEARPLDRVRFLLSNREMQWYEAGSPSSVHWPFYWQNQLVRQGLETDEPWYAFRVDVSATGTADADWTTIADYRYTEMYRSHPVFLDWDGNGKVDLLLGVLRANVTTPHDGPDGLQYRLYRNRGTSDAPVYSEWEPLREKGAPLQLGANFGATSWAQCGLRVVDLDGDGARDLVIQNPSDLRYRFYRNVSTAPGGVDFAFVGYLQVGGQDARIAEQRNQYFDLADIDGDGIVDLIDCSIDNPVLFRGVTPAVPAAVTDLALAPSAEGRLDIAWTRPAGAAAYRILWRTDAPLCDLDWASAARVEGRYTAAEGARQETTIPSLPKNTRIHVAVASLNASGVRSPLSPSVHTVTAPRARMVLRNGPDAPDGVRAYAGTAAVWLDAARAEVKMDTNPLEVRSRLSKLQGDTATLKVILVRFADLPALPGPLERATLEMTLYTDQWDVMYPPLSFAVGCHLFRHDWDPAVATFATRAANAPWAPGELAEGGTFLAQMNTFRTVDWSHTLSWDVTEGLRQATARGEKTLGLLLRVDFGGLYGANKGLRLRGSADGAAEMRPRLIVETANQGGN